MFSNYTIAQLYKLFNEKLSSLYNKREIDQFLVLSFQKLMGFNKLEISMNKELVLEESKCTEFSKILDRLMNAEPIQYILGSTFFYDLELKVNPAVLIPRPETEELVDWVLSCVKKGEELLDIGTGSGCIALALKSKMNSLQVKGIDVSEDALQIAKWNADHLGLEIELEKKDILKEGLNKKWNCILSNPPYIAKSESLAMESNVLDHEPSTALFVPDNEPLIFYERIAKLASINLHSKGLLFFEIHEEKAEEIVKLLASLGFVNIEVKKDMQGKNRMTKATV